MTSTSGMVSSFFSEFRRFATHLDTDCTELRSRVDAPVPESAGTVGLAQSLREMHAEAAELQASIASMAENPKHTDSLLSFLEAADALLKQNWARQKAAELELEQYGFCRPAEEAANDKTAIADDITNNNNNSKDDGKSAAQAPATSAASSSDMGTTTTTKTGPSISADDKPEMAGTAEDTSTAYSSAEEPEPAEQAQQVQEDMTATTSSAEAPEQNLNSTFTMETATGTDDPETTESPPPATAVVQATETAPDNAFSSSLENYVVEETTTICEPGPSNTADASVSLQDQEPLPATPVMAGRLASATGVAPTATSVEGTPKTPCLDDFGISSAALAILQKSSRKALPVVAPTPLRQATAGVSPSTTNTSSSSFDVSSYGITSVPLAMAETPEARIATATTTTPQAINNNSNSSSNIGTPDIVVPISAALPPRTPAHLMPVMPATPEGMHFEATAPEGQEEIPEQSALNASSLTSTASATTTSSNEHLLASVSDAEYGALPGYLRQQLDQSFLNEVLEALRDCVATSGMNPSDVVLSTTQLRDDLGLGDRARAVLLTLIKLKRMKAAGVNADGDKIYVFLSEE